MTATRLTIAAALTAAAVVDRVRRRPDVARAVHVLRGRPLAYRIEIRDGGIVVARPYTRVEEVAIYGTPNPAAPAVRIYPVSYTLTLATAEERDLVVGALRAAAEQRTRVARGGARTVAQAKATGADVRSRSVKITAILAEAGDLDVMADTLANAPAVPILTPTLTPTLTLAESLGLTRDEVATGLTRDEVATGPITAIADGITTGDGTSEAAQAIADLAGLTAYDPDAIEDPDTGATPEDQPTTPEEVLP